MSKVNHRRKFIRSILFILARGLTVSAEQKHARVTYLKCDTDSLSNVEALGEHGELVELKVEVQLRHTFSAARHEPARATRGKTVGLEAEGVNADTFILLALVVVSRVGHVAVNLTLGDVSGAGWAHYGYVEGDGAGFSEVVYDDVTRPLI